jgi:rsbT co-antagonist protein RsbR
MTEREHGAVGGSGDGGGALAALQAENAALQAENAALRARVAEFEHLQSDLRQNERLLEAIVDNSSTVIFVKDEEGRYLLINRRYETLFHVKRQDLIGKTDYDMFTAALADQLRANDRAVMAAGAPTEMEEIVPQDDGPHAYIAVKFPIYDANGRLAGVCGIATDITDRKRAEEERARLQQEVIDAQRTRLQELSTPVLEVWDDILVLPVVGSIDAQRSAEMMEHLLETIERKQCRFVILDVTGAPVIDSEVAQQLVKLVTAVEYLGARCVLTGVRSGVAQTLVSLGVSLGPLSMLRTLKHGLRDCIRRMDAGA